jgi:hypothetical protein
MSRIHHLCALAGHDEQANIAEEQVSAHYTLDEDRLSSQAH